MTNRLSNFWDSRPDCDIAAEVLDMIEGGVEKPSLLESLAIVEIEKIKDAETRGRIRGVLSESVTN
jgi:hypothetical protein